MTRHVSPFVFSGSHSTAARFAEEARNSPPTYPSPVVPPLHPRQRCRTMPSSGIPSLRTYLLPLRVPHASMCRNAIIAINRVKCGNLDRNALHRRFRPWKKKLAPIVVGELYRAIVR
jgi:hypothetical protein